MTLAKGEGVESNERGVFIGIPGAPVIGPFNRPLFLVLRRAITALAAGNTCVLKLSAALSVTGPTAPLELVPKLFDPRRIRPKFSGKP